MDLANHISLYCALQEVFRAVTGLPISTYFSAFKLLWLYENVPAVQQAIDSDEACFGTVDSWIIYQLTGGVEGGVHVTDGGSTSRAAYAHSWQPGCCTIKNISRIRNNRVDIGTVQAISHRRAGTLTVYLVEHEGRLYHQSHCGVLCSLCRSVSRD